MQQSRTKRAALLETVGGLGFSVAGVMLFYSIVILLHGATRDAGFQHAGSSAFSGAIAFSRSTLMFGVAPAVIVLLEGGVADQEAAKYGMSGRVYGLDWAAYTFAGLILIAAAVRTWRPRKWNKPNPWPHRTAISIAATVLALASVISTQIVGVYAKENTIGSDAFRLSQLVTLFLFCVAVIDSASAGRLSNPGLEAATPDAADHAPPQERSTATTGGSDD